ncbi:hypothetical protein EGW08_013181 [Elysia chlorotica]|uniref:GH18 domain-containing protein n=1 Tax=Elysia chlorotica TaxID=188477 RepID=A0A3S0ZNH5_ELYCH|nr:hypothetical protein EGW08_013181 [Elysia chlorotica]
MSWRYVHQIACGARRCEPTMEFLWPSGGTPSAGSFKVSVYRIKWAEPFPRCVMIMLAEALANNVPADSDLRLRKKPEYKRVCYYTNWSQYRGDQARFLPSDIDPFLCTHLIFAFAKVDNGVLSPYEWNDMQHPFLYKQFTDLKKSNPKLKTLLAVGGWNHGSLPFTAMVSSQAGRAQFIKHAIKYLRSNRFDGLDLDWEYPASRGSPGTDKANFAALAQELSEAFVQEATKSGEDRLLLTMAVPGGETLTLAGYDVKKLNKYVDFFNLMSYDLHGGWSPTIGHHAPLMGGYSWAPAQSKPENVIIRRLLTKRLRRGWLREEQVPFAVSDEDRIWVGYDDEQSLLAKVNYAKKKGLGGVMVWSLDQDDFTGRFGGHGVRYPLMTALRDELEGKNVNKPLLYPEPKDGPQKSGKPKEKELTAALKQISASVKNSKADSMLSKVERFPAAHPSAVPLFASLTGSEASSPYGHRVRQDKRSEPYRSLESPRKRVNRRRNKDSSKETAARSKYRHTTYSANKKRYTARGRNELPNESLSMKTKQQHNTPEMKDAQTRRGNSQYVQRPRSPHYDQKHPNPAMYDTNSARPDETNEAKRITPTRLVRGKQKRKSGKRGRGKSPHRKSPVLYHTVQFNRRKFGSEFPKHVPFSVISVQTNPPSDLAQGTPVLDPWYQDGNVKFVNANDRQTPRVSHGMHAEDGEDPMPEKATSEILRIHDQVEENRQPSYISHPSSGTFAASLNVNKNDIDSGNAIARSYRKPVVELSHAEKDGGYFNDRGDKYQDDQIASQYEDKPFEISQDADFDWLDDNFDDTTAQEREYQIIEHDPSKKWYEPILHKQREEELDLKLADSLPYNVPWRSDDVRELDIKPRAQAALQAGRGFESRQPGASQLAPYSGDKFVRVHAVPLSGLSLTDIVRQNKNQNELGYSKSSSNSTVSTSDKQQHLADYRSPQPWFDRDTDVSESNTESISAEGLGNSLSEPSMEVITVPLGPEEVSNGSRIKRPRRRMVKTQAKYRPNSHQSLSRNLDADSKKREADSVNHIPTVAADKPVPKRI